MAVGKHKFSWEKLGDIRVGRPNLGPSARLEVYRLMQFTMLDILEQRLGAEAADEIFYAAGYLAGTNFFEHVIGKQESFPDFVKALQSTLKELGVGILRVEKADLAAGQFVLTVSEDLDCSGLPETGEAVCVYDEGFIAGLLDSFTGKKFRVRETDCWCTGDRTCRFTASLSG